MSSGRANCFERGVSSIGCFLLRLGAAPRTNTEDATLSIVKVSERSDTPVLRRRVVHVAAVAWLSFVFARSMAVVRIK